MPYLTRCRQIAPTAPDPQIIAEAAQIIRDGGLVAFPTETVYGLGANALDAAAVQRIFVAKDRPAADPLIVHLFDPGMLPMVVASVPPVVEQLTAAFWPGPLTLILPRKENLPPAVSAGRATVAIRVPSHPVARALIQAAGTPIAAPSANRFGHTSPTTAEHVLADLDQRIDLVLDGGAATIGLESTVLDLTTSTPTILRPGGISHADLTALLGTVTLQPRTYTLEQGQGFASPGMLERHYAPDAELWLCIGTPESARAWLIEQVNTRTAAGQRAGLLLCHEDSNILGGLTADVELLGSEHNLDEIAHRLYAALRELDARRPDIILVRDFGSTGLGLAIRDRLTRAASGRVVQV